MSGHDRGNAPYDYEYDDDDGDQEQEHRDNNVRGRSTSSVLARAIRYIAPDRRRADEHDNSNIYVGRRRGRGVVEKSCKLLDQPDCSEMSKSDFKQQMLYESGKLRSQHCRFQRHLSNTPALLISKEIGMFTKKQNLSVSNRITASYQYLPGVKDPTELLRLRDSLFCGIYSDNGDVFLSACQDARIRMFDTESGSFHCFKIIECRDVGWSVLDVDFSHDGHFLIYSSWSDNIHLCNVRGPEEKHEALSLASNDQYRTAVFTVSFNSDSTQIIAGTNNGYIYVYDCERKECVMKIDAHEDDISSICFADSTGNIMFSAGDDGLIKVWDRRTLCEYSPLPVGILAGHYDSITYIDSRNDGRYLITNSKDQSIKLWDIRRFAGQDAVLATQRAVARQRWDYRRPPYPGKIVKPRLPGDCSLMTYYGHSVLQTLIRARISPAYNTGQQYIYTGDGMGRVIIYDILTGEVNRVLKYNGCDNVVRDISWHPYNQEIVSSGWDGLLLRWEHRS